MGIERCPKCGFTGEPQAYRGDKAICPKCQIAFATE